MLNLGNDGWSIGSWPVGSGSRDNNWGRTVGPDWSGSVSWGRGIDRLSRVLDISNVTSVGISSVGNSLEATIGKSNVVFSLGVIAVAGLRGSKVGTAVAVIDSIGVVVCWGDIGVDWGRSVSWDGSRAISRSWGNDGGSAVSGSRGQDGGWAISWSRDRETVLRSSSGSSHKSEQSNKALKIED